MANLAPAGMVWDGTRFRPKTEEELANDAAPQSAAPDFVGKPPGFLEDSDNIYRDEEGVIRNLRPSGGGSGPMGPPTQNRYGGVPSGQITNQDLATPGLNWGGGGGGGGSRGGGGGGGTGTSWSAGNVGGGQAANPWNLPTFQGGGGGGGSMSTGSIMTFNSDRTRLDPSLWNTPITGGSVSQSAGQAGGYANALANINPNVAAAPRTLYDRYQQHLMDPSSIMGDQGFQFALGEAQKATQRQLAAGRMRNSGNALRAMSDTTTGTILNQFRNLADVYGAGAGLEGQRYATEQGLGLDAQKLKLAALQGAGDLAVRSGTLYSASDDANLRARALDLDRVKNSVLSANESQANAIRQEAIRQASSGLGAYGGGTFSPSLSQQYLSLTGTPLTLNYTAGSTPASGGSMFGADFPRAGWYR